MDKRFITRYLGASAHWSGVTHSSPAAEPCAVLENKASAPIEGQEVAEVTSHDFWRKKDGLALGKSTEEKMAILRYGEEQVGWEKSKSKEATAIVNGSLTGEVA